MTIEDTKLCKFHLKVAYLELFFVEKKNCDWEIFMVR